MASVWTNRPGRWSSELSGWLRKPARLGSPQRRTRRGVGWEAALRRVKRCWKGACDSTKNLPERIESHEHHVRLSAHTSAVPLTYAWIAQVGSALQLWMRSNLLLSARTPFNWETREWVVKRSNQTQHVQWISKVEVVMPMSGKRRSFQGSPCPAIQQRRLLSIPRVGAPKAHRPPKYWIVIAY